MAKDDVIHIYNGILLDHKRNVYICHIFFIYSSISGHLGCLHTLAIGNDATMNMGVHMFLLSSEKYPEMELLNCNAQNSPRKASAICEP